MCGKVKTLIVEDDFESIARLKELIGAYLPEIEIIGLGTSTSESKEAIKNLGPELILMDIVMQDGNAFEILDFFPNSTFEVIFITAHSGFMKQAFDYFAFAYICKPYEDLELVRAVQKYAYKKEKFFNHQKLQILSDFIKENGTKFLVHVGNEHLVVDINEVIHCKSEGNYTQFHLTSGKKLLASNSLKHYEKILSYKGFYRMNRFNLINMNHIKSIYKKRTSY